MALEPPEPTARRRPFISLTTLVVLLVAGFLAGGLLVCSALQPKNVPLAPASAPPSPASPAPPSAPASPPRAIDEEMRARLRSLRTALLQFEADTGYFPARLEDLVATVPPTKGAGGRTLPAGSYKGPYFPPGGGIRGTGLPANPALLRADNALAQHWSYDPATSEVWSAVQGKTLDGVAYTAL